ncbi:hypothetical protein [Ulvibacterium marinum]|uniref:hypothetical protein n=1 Tax=Ulvibacterium marinum TaxID=2419782 RepID=UPI002494D203|nr:hypothetical protein [Ulvibacterium marinum]
MNFKKIALLSFFILLLINCSSEGSTDQNPDAGEKEEPKPEEEQTEIYFTLNVLGPRDNAVTDEWIIIHNKDVRPSVGNLPKELLEKYPLLEVEKLTYLSSRLKLKTKFGPNPGEWESEQITFYKR